MTEVSSVILGVAAQDELPSQPRKSVKVEPGLSVQGTRNENATRPVWPLQSGKLVVTRPSCAWNSS
jgi:hypothetical protein